MEDKGRDYHKGMGGGGCTERLGVQMQWVWDKGSYHKKMRGGWKINYKGTVTELSQGNEDQ